MLLSDSTVCLFLRIMNRVLIAKVCMSLWWEDSLKSPNNLNKYVSFVIMCPSMGIFLNMFTFLLYLLIYFWVTLHSMYDLTCSPCSGSMESYPLDCQETVSASLKSGHIKCWWENKAAGMLIHCLWECKDTITLKQLTGFLYSSTYSTYRMTIPLLGIYLRKMKADA